MYYYVYVRYPPHGTTMYYYVLLCTTMYLLTIEDLIVTGFIYKIKIKYDFILEGALFEFIQKCIQS